jgi:uncharacterized protein
MAHKFEIYRDKAGEYRVRFKYNSQIIFSSEGYSSKASALNLIASVQKNGPGAQIEDPFSEPKDLKTRLSEAPIPVSDGFVNIDHNSKEFLEFRAAFRKFEKSLHTSNDLGEMSPQELEIAKFETSQIGSESERDWLRPAHMWTIAKSTLLWIAERAADSVVGTLALAALAALAAMLGISF